MTRPPPRRSSQRSPHLRALTSRPTASGSSPVLRQNGACLAGPTLDRTDRRIAIRPTRTNPCRSMISRQSAVRAPLLHLHRFAVFLSTRPLHLSQPLLSRLLLHSLPFLVPTAHFLLFLSSFLSPPLCRRHLFLIRYPQPHDLFIRTPLQIPVILIDNVLSFFRIRCARFNPLAHSPRLPSLPFSTDRPQICLTHSKHRPHQQLLGLH